MWLRLALYCQEETPPGPSSLLLDNSYIGTTGFPGRACLMPRNIKDEESVNSIASSLLLISSLLSFRAEESACPKQPGGCGPPTLLILLSQQAGVGSCRDCL